MHILVDMDGVIADWGKQWDHDLNTMWPESRVPRHAEQRTFDLKAGLDPYDCDVVDMVMKRPGFYADLEPIEGAAEALHAMVAAGHQVDICTSPWMPNPTCVRDKLDWLDRHIGDGWSSKAIITTDKTRIRGQVLIDDKPDIHGEFDPEWSQILFDQPYNQNVNLPRIFEWSDWRTAVYGG